MATIPMVQPVTLETAQRYALNAGMMVVDVDVDSATDAESFLDLIEAAPEKWLGATSGSTTITEGRENWAPEHNGLRMPWVGGSYLDTAQPTIKTKLVEMKPRNLQLSSGAADISGEETDVITVKPRTTYGLDDYHTIVWFTNYGNEAIVAVILKNAICTTGLNWTVDDKKVATCDVEFRGHAADPLATDFLPIEYRIYKSSGNAA